MGSVLEVGVQSESIELDAARWGDGSMSLRIPQSLSVHYQ